MAGQNGQNLNNTFCSVSRDREVLAAFLKDSWGVYGKVTVSFPRFEQLWRRSQGEKALFGLAL